MKAIYATDLHGDTTFYEKLRSQILQIQPAFLFLGGDLFPNGNGLMALLQYNYDDFVTDFLVPWCKSIKRTLKQNYPSIFLIMGNDDSALEEINLRAHPELWTYCHNQCIQTNHFSILGYNCIPPSPFMNKDWERYDVSRFVDPGCVPPEEGHHSYPPDEYGFQKTIELELSEFDSICDFQNTICLFHSPPYNTLLDRAALDGKFFDHAPLDVHIGSIAIRKFIEEHNPLLGLFGHVHESSRITGARTDIIDSTLCVNCAQDDSKLCIASFEITNPVKTMNFHII